MILKMVVCWVDPPATAGGTDFGTEDKLRCVGMAVAFALK